VTVKLGPIVVFDVVEHALPAPVQPGAVTLLICAGGAREVPTTVTGLDTLGSSDVISEPRVKQLLPVIR